jgi:hypothetical protein
VPGTRRHPASKSDAFRSGGAREIGLVGKRSWFAGETKGIRYSSVADYLAIFENQ